MEARARPRTHKDLAPEERFPRGRTTSVDQDAARLISGLVHQIRNPLFAILASLDSLEIEAEPTDAGMDLLTIARQSLHRVRRILEELSDYARPLPLQMTEGPLQSVVAQAVAAVTGPPADGRARVVLETTSDQFMVSVDSERLRSALSILLEFATRRSSAGDAVTLRLNHPRQKRPAAAEIVIAPCGPPFPEEERQRCFEPFYDQRCGDTGLALAYANRVIEQHGGSLRAENGVGGAVLRVRIPLAPAADQTP